MILEMENFCDQCGGVIESECDYDAFAKHKVGRVVCPNCGQVNKPCNECMDHSDCDNCPYESAGIVSSLDEAPCANAIERYRQGVITLEELATKVKAWANGIIKAVRAERRAILAELRKGDGKKGKGAGK